MGGAPDREMRLRKLSALTLFIAACSSIIGWASAELYQAAAHGHVFWLRSRVHWVSRQDSPELFWFDVCIDLLAIVIVLGTAVSALTWPSAARPGAQRRSRRAAKPAAPAAREASREAPAPAAPD